MFGWTRGTGLAGAVAGALLAKAASAQQVYNDGDDNAGAVVLTQPNTTFSVNAGAAIQSGAISEAPGPSGIEKIGAGRLTITGPATYSGSTVVTGGTLRIGAQNLLPNGTAVVLGAGTLLEFRNAAGGTFGGNMTVGSLAGAGTIDNVATSLNFGGDNSSTVFSGVFAASGGGNLVKQGTGTFTFTGETAHAVDPSLGIESGTFAASNTGNARFLFLILETGTVFDMSGAVGQVRVAALGGNSGATDVRLGERTLMIGHETSSFSANFRGVVSGTGGITLIDRVTQRLSGVNTYTGATTIAGTQDARLFLVDDGSIATSSELNIVSPNGRFDIASTNSGAALRTLRGVGQVALGARTLSITDGSTDYTGVISGTGGVTVAGGTQTLSGVNTYTGATAVNGGALVVNGSIAPSSGLTVSAGALVGGTGTLPTSVINGALSPGNSIGTITVNGNLMLGAGALTIIEVGTTAADRINVSGVASLGGTLRLMTAGEALTFGTPYTIVHAAGGVNGTFGSVDSMLGSAIRTSITYDANNVFLTLDPNALAPLLAGAPQNVRSVATGIDRAVTGGADPSAFMNLFALPAASLPAALGQLSGEVHSATQGLGVSVSGQFLQAMLDPYALGRTPGSNPALAYAPADALAALPGGVALTKAAGRSEPAFDARRFAVWAAAFGSDGRIGGDAGIGSARRSERQAGVAAGADWRIAPGATLGFALSGGNGNASLDVARGSAKADVFQAGLYGMARLGGIDLGAALAYSRLEVDTTRAIPALGIGSVNGSYDSAVWSGRFEAAAPLAVVSGLSIAPFAAFQAHSVQFGAFTETLPAGGAAAALAVDGRSSTTSRGELGARFETRFGTPGFDATAFVRVAWANYFERDSSISAALVGLPGSAFTVTGARPDRDSAIVSTGLDWRITPSLSVGARFDGEFSGNVSQVAGTGRIRYTF